jgi:hypothetical protein
MWCCDGGSLPYVLKALRSFKTLRTTHPTIQYYILEDTNQQNHCERLRDVSEREQNISRIPVIHLKFTTNTIIGRECAVPNLC